MLANRNAPAFDLYMKLVTDVAAGLRSFDAARVALEPVNEPEHACNSLDWKTVQIALLSQARTAAPDLTLIATGACGSMVRELVELEPSTLAHLQPLLFTFHFYEPYVFSHQGAPWMTAEPVYRWLNKVPWPASAGSYEHTMAAVRARMAQDLVTPSSDKPAILQETQRVLKEYFAAQPGRAFLEGFFRQVHDWAARHGVGHDRLLLGEFGALRSDARYTAALSANRNRYLRDVREVAKSYKIPWAFWNVRRNGSDGQFNPDFG